MTTKISSVKLSVTSKLDGIKSWSLQAIETCPGSVGTDGELVPACSGCYATTGNYRFPNVKKPRLENREAWKHDNFIQDFIAALSKEKFFRWFDSGDMYSLALAEKILVIMQSTPNVQHWLPTRMYKFSKFHDVLSRMANLHNVVVRFSSDSIIGEIIDSGNAQNSTITPTLEETPNDAVACRAYERGGKCGGCRACWDKETPTIAYIAHGKKMQKIIRIGRES